MERAEPEPDLAQLIERVERLEARMTQFERDFRSLPVPPTETPDTEATAAPAPDEESRQEEEPDPAPENL